MAVSRTNPSSNLSAICNASDVVPVRRMGSPSKLAPVALFVYNRPEHTRRTAEALAKNESAKKTDLFVFADGAKNEAAVVVVEEVKQIARRLDGFRSVTLIERDRNLGLNKSIISGVTKLCEDYGRAIVIEDDIVTAPDFLTFTNHALEQYADEPKVFSVGGFNIPNAAPPSYPYDILFSYRFMPWGWGTWRDRWQKADWDIKDFSEFMADRERRKRFDRGGNDLSWMLARQMTGKVDGFWDTIWNYVHSKYEAVELLPVASRVYNIGIGSGVHGFGTPYAQAPLPSVRNSHYAFPESVQMDSHYVTKLQRICHRSRTRKLGRYVFDILGLRVQGR